MKITKFFVAVAMAAYCGVATSNAENNNNYVSPSDSTDHLMYDIDEVVVSATRNEITKRKAASIVGVTSRNMFSATASNSAADVLNFQPGLRVEYNCTNCGVPSLRINGLESQYSQILIDSRPVFSSLAAVYGLEQLPESMIERIEVVKGGGSALYGGSAIAGVVNVITRQPKKSSVEVSNTTSIYEGGGVDVNTSLNASVVSKDYRAGGTVYATVRDRDSYDRNGDGYSELPKLQTNMVGFRGFYKLNESSRLTGEYHFIEEYRRGGDSIDMQPFEVTLAEELKHRINSGSIKYDFVSENLKHKVSAYISAQNIDRDSYFGTDYSLDAYGTTFDAMIVGGGTYTLNMDNFLFMPAEFTAGVEYSNNYLKDRMLGYGVSINQLSEFYGVYAQNEWRNDKWSMLIGARLDKHNMIDGLILSPRFNVRYLPVEPLTLRASYSSGYRAPQVYDEDLHVGAVGGEISLISLDPDLKPEYSHSATISADFYKGYSNLSFNITAEGFYTRLNDVFVLTETGHDASGNLLLERTNADGATIYGVNLEGRMNLLNKLIVNGGLTWQNSTYTEAVEWSEDVEAQTEMFRSPDLYGFLAVNYLPISQLTISPSLTYTGSMLVQHCAGYIEQDTEVRTDSFWDINLKAAYEFNLGGTKSLELSLGVKNILDSFQSDLDWGVEKDAGYIYGPMMPRNYFFGAKFSF